MEVGKINLVLVVSSKVHTEISTQRYIKRQMPTLKFLIPIKINLVDIKIPKTK